MIIKFINKKTGLNIMVDFENKLYISMKYNELRTMTLFDLQKEFSFYKEISANEETFNTISNNNC